MDKNQWRQSSHYILTVLGTALLVLSLGACSSVWKGWNKKQLENKEFDEQVQIKEISGTGSENSSSETPKGVTAVPSEADTSAASNAAPTTAKEKAKTPTQIAIENAKAAATGKKQTKKKPKAGAATATTDPATTEVEDPSKPKPHLPALEDGEGFDGRKPIVNPFVVGEELEFAVRFFSVEAGRFTMAIKSFKEVNGKKSYHFSYSGKTNSVFSMFYALDDKADAYMDAETFVPYSYTIQANESKQIRDVRNFFDWKTQKAKTWDKKIKKGKEPEIKNIEWDLAPYAQNVLTVPYYLRTFTLRKGKKFSVNVGHDGKNMVMTAEVLREEKLSTPMGKLDTFVLKPSFELDGVFKPTGDNYIWITKDKYKRIVRIESKLKIGTLAVTIEKIKP